jgi:hypothetical protein
MQQFLKFITRRSHIITGQTTINDTPAASFQRQNQRLLVQLYTPDDGQVDARNMLSHMWTSSNKLEKLLNLGWFIWIV